jgi:malate dehydrogenase (oxaloacetate-decarboxylating)(NADP+)
MPAAFAASAMLAMQAPECFYVEREAQRRMNIPVFHDDQHGTAIIAGAGLINALDIIGAAACLMCRPCA